MCELADQLEQVHKWLHKCARAMSKEEIEGARGLEDKIVDMVNDSSAANGTKIIALWGALCAGIEHMESLAPPPEPDTRETIH